MRNVFTVVAALAGAFISLGLIGFALNALGLASLSFWGPRYEEANRKIVQQSIRRQEGVNEGLAALCLNMKLATDNEQKKAYANLIEVQASATSTELTADTTNCKAEAERVLAF
jgi:hypothetical protein